MRRAFVVVVLAAVAAGCGGQAGSPDPAEAPAIYELRGTIVAVDVPRRIVEIDHEAIPGFMAAMTMPYEVADPALLQGLAVGDRVRGTLRVDSRGYVITALQKV
jgi:Cu/Ag efflux protein CusF